MIKQLRFVFAAGIAAGLFASSGVANATTCAAVLACVANPVGCGNLPAGGGLTNTQAYQLNHPECFGSTSSTAGASQSVSGTTLQQMLTISNAVGARFTAFQTPSGAMADSGQAKGLAAGSMSDKLNVWGTVSGDNNKYTGGDFVPVNDIPNLHRVNSSLNVTNVVVGGDYLVVPTLALGFSVAFDRGSGSTESFKNGITNDGVKTMTTSGITYAPYLGWQINKDLSLDATIGWGDGDMTSTGNLTGEAKRFFYGTNLNYTHWYGNWQVTGKGGYLYGQEKFGDLKNSGAVVASTATNNKVDQWRLGAQAGYWMNGVLPYFGLAYSTDTRSTSASSAVQQATNDLGKSAWLWSLGVNFISLKNSMTGGIAYSQESGRARSKRDNLMANINLRF